MNILNLSMLILTAASYFYFHWQYFAVISSVCQIKSIKPILLTGSFLFIYFIFSVCSFLELHLIINWGLFFLLLLASTLLYCCSSGGGNSLFFALCGIYYGLSVNIFCRCIIAVLIDRPLSSFGNDVYSGNNLKALPVLLGFAIAGAAMQRTRMQKPLNKLRLLINYPDQIRFLSRLLVGLMLYLAMNLLLYQTAGNDFLLKLWGIKSSGFAAIGFYLGMRYAMRMCELIQYRERTHCIQKELIQREQEAEKLSQLAYRDSLTGCYNRAQAILMIDRRITSKSLFTLCFIDLDRLKYVNDTIGHEGGDRYLALVADALRTEFRRDRDQLFRYGGDEFILLLSDVSLAQAKERLEHINLKLKEVSSTNAYPFLMSVSYGLVQSREAVNAENLIQAADRSMYAMKISHRF